MSTWGSKNERLSHLQHNDPNMCVWWREALISDLKETEQLWKKLKVYKPENIGGTSQSADPWEIRRLPLKLINTKQEFSLFSVF